jgi:hypothetical protein
MSVTEVAKHRIPVLGSSALSRHDNLWDCAARHR